MNLYNLIVMTRQTRNPAEYTDKITTFVTSKSLTAFHKIWTIWLRISASEIAEGLGWASGSASGATGGFGDGRAGREETNIKYF